MDPVSALKLFQQKFVWIIKNRIYSIKLKVIGALKNLNNKKSR